MARLLCLPLRPPRAVRRKCCVFMIITKIEPQKKNKNRSSVYLDDSFAFGIDNFDLMKLKLKAGMEIDAQELSYIRETTLFTETKNYGMKLTGSRSYTESGLCRKMREKGYGDKEIEKTIEFLKEYRLIDDEDYARRFVNDAINIKGYGKYRIKNELLVKGIDKDLAEKILSEYDFNEIEEEKILPLAAKKLGGNFSIENIAKTKRYLASRGFGFSAIDSAVRKITGGEDWCE